MANEEGASWKKTLVISCMAMLVAAVLTTGIFLTEPVAKRGGATKQTAMLVDVVRAERGTFRPTIVATGTVQAEQDVMLRARVSGEVVRLAPEFSPGAFVEEGDTLLWIDARDHQNRLQEQKSALNQAKSALAIEMGRQGVARQELELIDGNLSPEEQALVLRKPQLDAAQAAVEAAEAALRQARLDVARTTVEAPFDAQILSRNVNVGSLVSASDTLARLAGLESYWVVAGVPRTKLRWLSFPDAQKKDAGEEAVGSEVLVRNRSAWPKDAYRKGQLHSLVGALDTQTRLARVLIKVPDPLARKQEAPEAPALLVGEFLETRIRGNELEDVIRLDRRYVRDADTVWVMMEGKLEIRDVEIVLSDQEHAYISRGLGDTDQIVATNLATVTEGARLRLRSSEEP